jgi:hypothetical protein
MRLSSLQGCGLRAGIAVILHGYKDAPERHCRCLVAVVALVVALADALVAFVALVAVALALALALRHVSAAVDAHHVKEVRSVAHPTVDVETTLGLLARQNDHLIPNP